MKITEFKLDNGLRVLNAYDENLKSFEILFSVKAGSIYETQENNGIFHLLEHLLAKKIRDAILDLGGIFKATTSRELVTFSAKTIFEEYKSAIKALSEVTRFNFDQNYIKSEISIVEREIESTKSATYLNQIYKNAMNLPILGSIKSINSLTSEKIREAHKDAFNSENCLIILASPLENDDIFEIINEYFGKLPSGVSLKPNSVKTGGATDDQQSNNTKIVFKTGSYLSEDYPYIILTRLILYYKLFDSLRIEQGLTYGPRVDLTVTHVDGHLTISLKDKGLEIEKNTLNAITNLSKEELNRYLTRAKKYILAWSVFEKEDLDYFLRERLNLEHQYGFSQKDYLQKVSDTNTENIETTLRKYLSKENALIIK